MADNVNIRETLAGPMILTAGKAVENAQPINVRSSATTLKSKSLLSQALQHHLTSMFITAMGVLIVAFGCIFALLMSADTIVSLIVVFVGLITGTLFIGFAKMIEAAETYLYRVKKHVPCEEKPMDSD
jgi:hypothetical protein